MAAQPDPKRAVVTDNHSEIRPRGGRPAGARDTKPRAKRVFSENQGFDYSRVKFTVNRMTDFARYIEGYPNKAGLKMYLYRVKPIIDLARIGIDDTNIRITTEIGEMTEEFIGKTYGRGMYKLKLNDIQREGITEICRCTVTIDDPEFPPPIYDIRTLCLGEQGNQDEVQRQIQLGNLVRDAGSGFPRIRTQGDTVPAAAVPVAAAPAPAPAAATGGIVSNDLAAELIRGLLHRAGDNPGERVKETIEMAKLLQAQPAAAPAVDMESMMERIITRLQGGGVQGKSLDDFAIYERVSGFIDKIRGTAGDAAGAAAGAVESPAAWVASLPGILRELRAGIPEVINAVRGLRVEVGGRQVASVTQDGPPAALPRAQMTMKDRIAEVAQMAFEKMTAGVKGLDFAVYICMYHPGGLEVYRFLMPGGTLGVISLCAMDDVTRGIVNDPTIRPQLEMWLDDFFTFDPDGGVDDGTIDHVASPAPNGAVPAGAAAPVGSSSSR